MGYTKKNLKKWISEVFDAAIAEGAHGFQCKSGDETVELEFTIESVNRLGGHGLLGMRMKTEGCHLTLWYDSYDRKSMIRIFTDFLWVYLGKEDED